MDHKEVVKLIQDFICGKQIFILPSTTRDSYESEAEHRLGIERHIQLSEIIQNLRLLTASIEQRSREQGSPKGG